MHGELVGRVFTNIDHARVEDQVLALDPHQRAFGNGLLVQVEADDLGRILLDRVADFERFDIGVKSLILALAQASRHPLSEALTRGLRRFDVRPAEVTSMAETPGFGVEAQWAGSTVKLGRPQCGNLGDALATELSVYDRPPWDQGKLVGLLDHGELAAR